MLHNYQPLNMIGTHFMVHQYGLKKAGRILEISNEFSMIFYEISTDNGMSGSPLIFG
jgi:hypothetical protein